MTNDADTQHPVNTVNQQDLTNDLELADVRNVDQIEEVAAYEHDDDAQDHQGEDEMLRIEREMEDTENEALFANLHHENQDANITEKLVSTAHNEMEQHVPGVGS